MAERRVAEAELQIVRQKTILDAMVRGNHSHRVIDQARSALARFEDKGSEAQDTPRVGFYMLCRRLPCASNRKSDKMVYDMATVTEPDRCHRGFVRSRGSCNARPVLEALLGCSGEPRAHRLFQTPRRQ
jgi:hypothetical protein